MSSLAGWSSRGVARARSPVIASPRHFPAIGQVRQDVAEGMLISFDRRLKMTNRNRSPAWALPPIPVQHLVDRPPLRRLEVDADRIANRKTPAIV